MPAAWRDALGAWRNRVLGREETRERLIRWWPTRWVARKEAARLFDLVGGFVYSQVLYCVVRLGWIGQLSQGPCTREALAAAAAMPAEALQRLLDAASALELLELRGDGRWQLGPLGAALQDNAAVQAMVLHHSTLYADLADPLALLRSADSPTRLAAFWDYAQAGRASAAAKRGVEFGRGAVASAQTEIASESASLANPANQANIRNDPLEGATKAGNAGDVHDMAADYSRLMSASQPLVARLLLNAYPLARHRCLLDVGGGDGSFARRVAQAVPSLHIKVWDLPPVVALAQASNARAGLETRIECVPGNFHENAVPPGADVISLLRVLHDHDDAPALDLLKRLCRALPDNGVLLLAEPMADAPGAQRMGAAYFGFYLWAMRSGRPRSLQENKALLQQAGFNHITAPTSPLPLQAQILVAAKSA